MEGAAEEIVKTLQAKVLWEAFSVTELTRECNLRRVPLQGFDSKANNEEQRDKLIDTLMFDACKKNFEAKGIPVLKLHSFRACANVPLPVMGAINS